MANEVPNIGQVTFGVQPIQAPLIFATFFQTSFTSNEVSVMFAMNGPGVTGDGSLVTVNHPTGILSLSPQSAKDFVLLLSDSLAQYEAKYGEIVTDFTLSRAQKTDGGQ